MRPDDPPAPPGPGRHDALGDVLVEGDRYYILATSSLAEGRRRVLKQDDTFVVFDQYGDLKPLGTGEEGLYHRDTRHLSSLLLRFGRERPLLLSSNADEDNLRAVIDLANPDLLVDGHVAVPRGTVHLQRTRFLWRSACHERWTLHNFGRFAVDLTLTVHFDSDFADLFEVRGARRERRGRRLPARLDGSGVELAYEGLDGVVRRTRLRFSSVPDELLEGRAGYRVRLPPGGAAELALTIGCGEESKRRPRPFASALAEAEAARARGREGRAALASGDGGFDGWVARSLADLEILITRTPQGDYPYAGVPWYSTPFGRDAIWTALETLWLWPELARGVLAFLAERQATELRPEQDAEPGKILHEMRGGEMAALGEVPFGRYYGSIDSTPLFLMLAGEYFRRSADFEFAAALWPAVERALGWIERWGDVDGDGFVEYHRRNPDGLVQQGWKDSHDSIFHADGSDAEGPIALAEVQGYVFAARRAAADLAEALGRPEDAAVQRERAEALRRRFEEAFWCEEIGTYALALDATKRRCAVRASNAGHCLFSGIAGAERARRAAETLLSPASFNGWGIRTVAAGEARYNPISYHNGSVWPHDTAIVAAGLGRYGARAEAARLLAALYDTARQVDLQRLPELLCGFERLPGSKPTLYPVACAPQAWSAGAVFLLLQACLGLSIDAPRREVRFTRPWLPAFLPSLRIDGLTVGAASLDLLLTRYPESVGIHVVARRGEVDVVSVK